MKIEFTKEEAQAMINLIHEAVKAVGLQDGGTTAKNAAYLNDKLQSAFPAETPKEIRDEVVKKGKK